MHSHIYFAFMLLNVHGGEMACSAELPITTTIIMVANRKEQQSLSRAHTFFPVCVRCHHATIRGRGQSGKGTREWKAQPQKLPEKDQRLWTAARTMEVLRQRPLAIAQRLVHCAIAVSTAVLDRVTKTMSVALLLTNNLDNSEAKNVQLAQPSSTSLLMISSGQMWGSSSTSLL